MATNAISLKNLQANLLDCSWMWRNWIGYLLKDVAGIWTARICPKHKKQEVIWPLKMFPLDQGRRLTTQNYSRWRTRTWDETSDKMKMMCLSWKNKHKEWWKFRKVEERVMWKCENLFPGILKWKENDCEDITQSKTSGKMFHRLWIRFWHWFIESIWIRAQTEDNEENQRCGRRSRKRMTMSRKLSGSICPDRRHRT